jgi:hypothetical protein
VQAESLTYISTIGFILLVLVLSILTLSAFRYSLYRIPVVRGKAGQLFLYVAVLSVLWLFLTGMIALFGISWNPEWFLAILIGFAFAGLAACVFLVRSRLVGLCLRIIPLSWLLGVQSFRILSESLFWIGYLAGFVPVQMTFAGLNQDILVGLTAPMAAWVFFGHHRFRKVEALVWNIFGLISLGLSSFVAVISLPSSFRVFTQDPSSLFLGYFPFIWWIGVLVPLGIGFHLLSIRQVLTSKRVSRFRL